MTERTELANIMLKKAGWFPGRKVDLELIRDEFHKAGIELSLEVRNFLEEFDGIYFYDEELIGSGSQQVISIKSSEGVGFWESEIPEISKINQHFGTNLARIGEYGYCGQILISGDGKLWFNYYQLSLEHGIVKGIDQNSAFNDIAEEWNQSIEFARSRKSEVGEIAGSGVPANDLLEHLHQGRSQSRPGHSDQTTTEIAKPVVKTYWMQMLEPVARVFRFLQSRRK
jgi:SUKH-3 immunity protein